MYTRVTYLHLLLFCLFLSALISPSLPLSSSVLSEDNSYKVDRYRRAHSQISSCLVSLLLWRFWRETVILISSRALIISYKSISSQDRILILHPITLHFMNCAFAANKSDIVIDGCFIPSGGKEDPKTSPFLEQIVDQTKGV